MRQVYLVPLLHPAFILRGQFGQEPFQVRYLKRVVAILEGRPPPIIDIEQPPPGAVLYPTPADLQEWRRGIDHQGITVDIENAGRHLTILGMCRIVDEVPIVVRFRKQGGDPWWDVWAHLEAVVSECYEILSDPTIPKVFQNGQAHDIPLLEEIGFEVEGYESDTLVAMNYCYPEVPKRLEFMGVAFGGIPAWKSLVKEADEEEGK